MGAKEARSRLDLARGHLKRVQVASSDPQDPEGAVTWAFYAYENAVVAAAEITGLTWEKNHYSKSRVAKELHSQGAVSRDLSSKLLELNDLRKDIAYGESGPDLEEVDLEDLATELEGFVDEVGALIEKAVP